jgi:hypothetical protein
MADPCHSTRFGVRFYGHGVTSEEIRATAILSCELQTPRRGREECRETYNCPVLLDSFRPEYVCRTQSMGRPFSGESSDINDAHQAAISRCLMEAPESAADCAANAHCRDRRDPEPRRPLLGITHNGAGMRFSVEGDNPETIREILIERCTGDRMRPDLSNIESLPIEQQMVIRTAELTWLTNDAACLESIHVDATSPRVIAGPVYIPGPAYHTSPPEHERIFVPGGAPRIIFGGGAPRLLESRELGPWNCTAGNYTNLRFDRMNQMQAQDAARNACIRGNQADYFCRNAVCEPARR